MSCGASISAASSQPCPAAASPALGAACPSPSRCGLARRAESLHAQFAVAILRLLCGHAAPAFCAPTRAPVQHRLPPARQARTLAAARLHAYQAHLATTSAPPERPHENPASDWHASARVHPARCSAPRLPHRAASVPPFASGQQRAAPAAPPASASRPGPLARKLGLYRPIHHRVQSLHLQSRRLWGAHFQGNSESGWCWVCSPRSS